MNNIRKNAKVLRATTIFNDIEHALALILVMSIGATYYITKLKLYNQPMQPIEFWTWLATMIVLLQRVINHLAFNCLTCYFWNFNFNLTLKLTNVLHSGSRCTLF